MHTHNGTLYPMLGVGAFMTMFWTGVVVGYELGLGCVSMLITGLLFGCIASVGVCELQRRDGQGLASDPRAAMPGYRHAAERHRPGAPAGAARGRSRPRPFVIAPSLPVRPS
jgi:hypothetical protein